MFWLVAVGKRDWFVVVGRVFAISGFWLDRSSAVQTRVWDWLSVTHCAFRGRNLGCLIMLAEGKADCIDVLE